MTIHDDAEAARRAVYDAEFARLQAEIDRLKAAQVPAVPPVKLPAEQPPVVVVPPVTAPPAAGRLGQHWATHTPRPGQLPALEVDPDWNALRAAASEYGRTREYLIRPGSLTGRGAGSSMPGEIANLNILGPNGERVLIRPRDGYGTVKITKGVSFVNVTGLSFMGIEGTGQAVLFRNSKHSGWGWSELNMCRATANDKSACDDIEFIEPVSRGILVASDDRHRFVTAKAGSSMSRITLRGGYGSSIYIPAGSAAHCDHLQVERQDGGGTITGITVDDYVAYGAHSQTFMFAGIPGTTLMDTVVVGGPYMEKRYPRPANTKPKVYEPKALNGSSPQTTLIGDNYVFGSIAIGKPEAPGWTFTGPGRLLTQKDVGDVQAFLDEKYPEPTAAEMSAAWTFR